MDVAGDGDALAESKAKETENTVKTTDTAEDTDTTREWGNHRYLMYDGGNTTHDADYWSKQINDYILEYILKEDNNEGAKLKTVTWTSGMTKDTAGNYTVEMSQGPENNRFGYPQATLVVQNADGKTRAYTNVTINVAKSIAAYFGSKYNLDTDANNDKNVSLNDDNSQNVSVNLHVNDSNSNFSGEIKNGSINTISVNGWKYGDDQYKNDYLNSLITEISLTLKNADLTKVGNTGTTEGFTIQFTDHSTLSGTKGKFNVIGGVAKDDELQIFSRSDFSKTFSDASVGITKESQSQIAKWSPTYEWVDEKGYNTGYSNSHTSIQAKVKITYHTTGNTPDGTQIVPVTIKITTQPIANSLGTEILDQIDHITSHPISAGTENESNSSSWSSDTDPNNNNRNLNGLTWGIDKAQIVWKDKEDEAKYAKYINSVVATSEHSFPITNAVNKVNYYIVNPGLTFYFSDGSSAQGSYDAWICYPKKNETAKTDLNTGDTSQFTSDSAKADVINALPPDPTASSFDASYQWVVKDSNGTYTFDKAHNIETGKPGVTIKGYRSLTSDDIKDAGTKQLYVLIGYTKNARSGSPAGTYDGYYVVPVSVTLKGKIQIGVRGNGKQTETYKGSAYTTSDLDLSNYIPLFTDTNDNPNESVTLTPTSGNKLTADDYTFNPNPNDQSEITPTNAGEYDVYLKQSGINKIKKWTNAENYDWSNVSTKGPIKVGTFTIAKVQLTVNNQGSETSYYNGNNFGTAGFSPAKFKPSITGFVNGETAPTIPDGALKASDFYFTSDTDTKDHVTPNGAGTYHVYLFGTSIAKLQSWIGSNYELPTSTTNSWGTFIISERNEATATLGGTNSKTYDGSAVTTEELNSDGKINVTITIPNSNNIHTYQLQNVDYTWNTNDGKAPTNVGNYTIILTKKGKDNIAAIIKNDAKADGIENVTVGTIDGSATFSITPADAIILQQGSKFKTYNGTAASVTFDDLKNSNNWKLPDTLPKKGSKINFDTLTDGDFDWYSEEGTDLGKFGDTNITNAGTYTIRLNKDGLSALQSANPNYKITESGSYTYTINKAPVTITQQGSQSKIYDGNSANVTINDIFGIGNWMVPSGISNGDLNSTDFDWYDGTNDLGNIANYQPTDAGNYTIKLNEQGKSELQKANPNYDVTVNGNYSYTIKSNQQSVVVNFEDKDNANSVVGTVTESGVTNGVTSLGDAQDKLSALEKQGYKLVDGSQLPSSYTFQASGNDPIVIKLGHNTTTIDQATDKGAAITGTTQTLQDAISDSNLNKTVTRTIKDGSQADNVQSVSFKRSANVDMVTGKVLGYTDWTHAGSTTWAAYTPQTPSGYSVDKIEETVNGTTTTIDSIKEVTPSASAPDETITITYSPISQPATPDKPAQGSDQGTKPGSTPASTPGEKPGDKPGINPVQPTKPEAPGNKPHKPVKPNKPSKPTNGGSQNFKPSHNDQNFKPNSDDFPKGTHWENGKLVGPNGEIFYENGRLTRVGRAYLPQTGEKQNKLAAIFGALASGIGLLSLIGERKRKDKD